MSLILQKQGDDDGWIPEKAGLDDTGSFMAKPPITIRTKGHGSMGIVSSRAGVIEI